MNNFKYNPIKMTAFKWFVLENFPFLEEDFDSLTSYGLWCKLKEYFDKVATKTNEMGTQVESLTNAFIALKDYVDNYFANLDVQDEINNKLDDMAQDGTLQEIVSTYLNSKAIFAFNNVQNMKSSTNLINGSFAQTLGFYEINDGGSSLYKIREITNNDVIDNQFIIPILNNNLVAELVITEYPVSIKKLGAIPTSDCSSIINNLINKNYSVLIPKGTWLCNPLVLKSGTKIIGENINYQVIDNNVNMNENLSILQCNQDCDTFIDCTDCDHIELSICLASCKSKGYYEEAKNIQNFVKLNHTCYSTFDLFILCLNNNGLSIKESWENTFKRLYFRGILNTNVNNIKCLDSEKGISQNVFYDIQSEGFGACILDCLNGLFYHNKIYSILVELTPYEPFTRTEDSANIQIPLFKIGNGSNNIIDSIQINNFSFRNAIENSEIYEHSVFYVNSNGKAFGFKIGTLMFDTGVNNRIHLIKQTGIAGYLTSYLIFDSIINPTQQLIVNDLENMNFLKINEIFNRGTNTIARNNLIETITKWYKPVNSSKTPLVSNSTDYNSFNFENAVAKIGSVLSKIATLKVQKDDKIKIYYKSDSVINYEIKLMQRNNTTADTITGTLEPSSTYQIAELYNVISNGLYIASISFSSSGNSFIADIFK